MAEIHFQNYRDIPVSVDEYGSFTATVNGLHLRDQTYAGLKVRIEEELKAEAKAAKLNLSCYAVLQDPDGVLSVKPLTLSGVSRKDGRLRWKEHDGEGFQFAVPATNENALLLADLVAAENACRSIRTTISNRRMGDDRFGGRIQPSEYGERLQRVARKYQECMNNSTPDSSSKGSPDGEPASNNDTENPQ